MRMRFAWQSISRKDLMFHIFGNSIPIRGGLKWLTRVILVGGLTQPRLERSIHTIQVLMQPQQPSSLEML